MHTDTVITRFPPSPTGHLHIGNIRTLLFNYLYARGHNGRIVMRFEDTDTERSREEFKQSALETLATLGLDFDEGPYAQSERTQRYRQALQQLIESNHAYIAEASEHEPGEHIVRFRNPNKKITFTDLVRGDISIDTTDFGDFVIARSLTKPVYHLSVVVDDIDMDITHVIRGEDHITSTPRQILLIEALGAAPPHYAHLPLIIGNDRKKLGKRHGATTWQEFEDRGILPSAMINYLALLGWNPGDDREIFTKEELIRAFSINKVNPAPAMFSYEKLTDINKHHMLALDTDTYEHHVRKHLETARKGDLLLSHPRFADIVRLLLRERMSTFRDVVSMLEEGEFDWLASADCTDKNALVWKHSNPVETCTHLTHVRTSLHKIITWDRTAIETAIMPYADERGRGNVLWPLRMALTNMQHSPDPFTVAYILGKDETIKRLDAAISLFGV